MEQATRQKIVTNIDTHVFKMKSTASNISDRAFKAKVYLSRLRLRTSAAFTFEVSYHRSIHLNHWYLLRNAMYITSTV